MSRKLVVIVNGRPRSGKDTVVNWLKEELAGFGWVAEAMSSIDPIREAMRELGVPVDLKTPAERDLLAEVKAALEKYDNWATRSCVRAALHSLDCQLPSRNVVFLHMREPRAIAFTKTLLPEDVEFLTIFVDRPDAEMVNSNAADAHVADYSYDLTVRNAGTLEDLARVALFVANQINKAEWKREAA